MEHIKVAPHYTGFRVSGEKLEISFLLNEHDSRISVSVVGLHPGESHNALLTYEGQTVFDYAEIHVVGDVLSCFGTSESYPFFAQGFRVILESGMSALINQYLPALELLEKQYQKGLVLFKSATGAAAQNYQSNLLGELIACKLFYDPFFDTVLKIETEGKKSFEDFKELMKTPEFQMFFEEVSASYPNKMPQWY